MNENNLKRIEDFPGVVILADENDVVTEDKLNQHILAYAKSGSFHITFTQWLETVK